MDVDKKLKLQVGDVSCGVYRVPQ